MAQRKVNNHKRNKKGSVPFEDFDRLAENLILNYPGSVYDYKSLNKTLNEYFEGNVPRKFLTKERKQEVLKHIKFKSSGGKDIKQDRLQNAKTVFPDTEEGRQQYNKIGGKKSDLNDVDTKNSGIDTPKVFKKTPSKSTSNNYKVKVRLDSLNFIGKVKNKVVKSRREQVKVLGKTQIRFRDKKGRFVSVKKK